jgi:hypothetical protein
MDFLIPIAFFASIAYVIKVIADARIRSKMIANNVTGELLRSMLLTDEVQRRHTSLRWGIVLICLAAGFGLLELLGLREVGPGTIAVLLGVTGLGNLLSYFVGRKLEAKPGDAR